MNNLLLAESDMVAMDDVLLQPLLMRFSRTLWLSWFVKYDAHWKEKEVNSYERIVKEQMNNW